MHPSTQGQYLLDPAQRSWRSYIALKDDQGANMMVSPHFYVRGQAGPQGVATFAASAASGTTETVTLALPSGFNPPEYVELVLINHADATVSWTVTQTVNDFVAGSGTVNVQIAASTTDVAASGGAEQTLIQFPYTTDGPLTVTFKATANMTNGGNVGAQIRWQD